MISGIVFLEQSMKNPFILFGGILIITIVGAFVYWYFFFSTHENRNQELFKKYFKAYPNTWTSDVANTQDSSDLKYAAMRYYDSHNYKLALEAFHEFEPQEQEDGYYNLYLGICGLESGFVNIAIINLINSADNFKDFNLVYSAKWYLALAYLRAERNRECIEILNEIIRVKHSYSNSCNLLLKDLSK